MDDTPLYIKHARGAGGEMRVEGSLYTTEHGAEIRGIEEAEGQILLANQPQPEDYIYGNFCYLRDFLHTHLPQLILHETEGTYLAWVNIEALGMSAEAFCQALAKDEHVLFNPSEMYGAEHYVRINLATSREVLAEALNRLKDFI